MVFKWMYMVYTYYIIGVITIGVGVCVCERGVIHLQCGSHTANMGFGVIVFQRSITPRRMLGQLMTLFLTKEKTHGKNLSTFPFLCVSHETKLP